MPSRPRAMTTLWRFGNSPCLDFVNTVAYRAGEESHDYLRTYDDLLRWARDGKLLPPGILRSLSRAASAHPKHALQVLRRATELRELLYRVFLGLAEGQKPLPADLAALNEWLAGVLRHRRIVKTRSEFFWAWQEGRDELDRPLWSVVLSAAELLVSGPHQRIKECPGPYGCGWLFLDASKNSSRRWCSMRYCGNIIKARRHYRRSSGRAQA